MNLKDNNRSLNIGDSAASQQMILGTNFLKWFDEFVEMLMTQPYLGVVPNPAFVKTLLRYKAEKSVSFLSHHVNVVDNNQVSTVKSEERQEEAQLGDTWNSTKEENTVTTKTDENYTPTEGEKPLYDDTYKAPPVEAGVTTDIKPEPTVPPLPEKDTIQSNITIYYCGDEAPSDEILDWKKHTKGEATFIQLNDITHYEIPTYWNQIFDDIV